VTKFNESGQSGGSAPYTARAISEAVKKLCLQEPLCDITGIDEEWNDVSEMHIGEQCFQNNRLSSVFKEDEDGKPYFLDAITWQGEKEWDAFAGSVYIDNKGFQLINSSQIIKLPLKPKRFYIDVIRIGIEKKEAEKRELHYTEGNDECYYYILKDVKQLDKVFKYYVKPEGLVLPIKS